MLKSFQKKTRLSSTKTSTILTMDLLLLPTERLGWRKPDMTKKCSPAGGPWSYISEDQK